MHFRGRGIKHAARGKKGIRCRIEWKTKACNSINYFLKKARTKRRNRTGNCIIMKIIQFVADNKKITENDDIVYSIFKFM